MQRMDKEPQSWLVMVVKVKPGKERRVVVKIG